MMASLRKVVIVVAIANLAYFGVEFSVAAATSSVSLFADSIDFLEDASVNLLIAFALGWSAGRRARLGMALAGILLVPGRDTVDSMGKAYGSDATGSAPPVADRSGCPGDQFIVRVHAGALSGTQRQSDASRVPLSPQRY